MTTTPLDPRARVLDAATGAATAKLQAEVDLLAAAAEWARIHPASGATGYAGFGDDVEDPHGVLVERPTPLAGEGAPLVAEFAPAELAAVLGWSTETVKQLMGDALELGHRLPLTWKAVQALRMPVWMGRFIAQQTRDLDPRAARRADEVVARQSRLTRRLAQRIVDEQRLYADPDRAAAEEEQALKARRVYLHPGRAPATVDVEMTLDIADADAFGATVAALAGRLEALGDRDDLDVRRARAVGIMADPQGALDLLTDRRASAEPPSPGPASRPAGKVHVNLHLDLATLADLAVHGITGPVAARTPGLVDGVATTDLVADWMAGWLGSDAKILVRPYADLSDASGVQPVDGHDPPESMAWYVRTRDPMCVFPGCVVPSVRCDLDHIEPYGDPDEGGPPGQTHPDNLAPLCRGHHRAKTHGRWSYVRLPSCGYSWTSPTGRVIDVPPPRRP